LAEETRKWARSWHNSAASRWPWETGFYDQIDLDETSAYNYAKEIISSTAWLKMHRKEWALFWKTQPQWRDL
jgi:hypothetical protein